MNRTLRVYDHTRGWLAFLLLLWLPLSGCTPSRPATSLNRLPAAAQQPTLMFEGFKMTSMRGLEKEWDFTARAAQVFERENTARAQDIRVVYWRQGKEASTLTAKRGFIQTETRDLRAENQVVMVSQEGVVLRTERLSYDHVHGELTTDLPVRVEREGSVLTGVGLRADSGLKRVNILSDVKINVPSIKSLKPQSITPTAEPNP
jgi:LPS export ABC transporter protein LptC